MSRRLHDFGAVLLHGCGLFTTKVPEFAVLTQFWAMLHGMTIAMPSGKYDHHSIWRLYEKYN